MDNSDSVGYNVNKKNKPTITQSTDYAKQWLDKNQGLLKYAGDSAKKSIYAGLDEAPSFMRDADEGTYFSDVQTASVKRHLAKDANDNKLHNSALMEMIGHLSKDNKGPYLKHTLPLQTFIDAKDNFDFNQNNYTTTKNIDTTPDENVRQLQRELNEAGYTDKFGEPLKEDGIYGGKTAYADDSKKADSVDYTNQRFGNRSSLPSRGQTVRTTTANIYPVTSDDRYKTANANGKEYQAEHMLATKDDLQPKMWGKSEVKLASTNYDAKLLNNTPSYEELKKLMEDGTLSPGDENRNELKKTMLRRLSANWWSNDNQLNRDLNKDYADKLRNFDDNSFNRAILLNKEDGASGFGHNAVMLLNKENEGLVFSFYSTNSQLPDSLGTHAEMRFAILDEKQVNKLLYGDGSFSVFMTASDHSVKTEKYDRFAYFDLKNNGYNMYKYAVDLYEDPKYYSLVARQCDNIACNILLLGGIYIDSKAYPNLTYDTLFTSKWTVHDNIKKKG